MLVGILSKCQIQVLTLDQAHGEELFVSYGAHSNDFLLVECESALRSAISRVMHLTVSRRLRDRLPCLYTGRPRPIHRIKTFFR